ncbi:hypothetical protein IDZ49_11015 [Francisella tularensis]|nr:hypothetical protein [Francisella tularensis]
MYTKTLVLQYVVMLIGLLLIDIFDIHHVIDDLFVAVVIVRQNSFTTVFFGGFARAAHMTGTTTDLVIEICRDIRGNMDNIWKNFFVISCMIMFLMGNAV